MDYRRAALLGLGLVGTVGLGGCVRRSEFLALQTQYYATHDTLRALWKTVDSTNKVLLDVLSMEPPPRPPVCPPRCIPLAPPLPDPIER
jgi:hypothetical protein